MTAVRVLMIGLNSGYEPLLRRRPDVELYVLEEPDIIAANPTAFAADWLRAVRPGRYQQCAQALTAARAWHAEMRFDAVLPGMEYAVTTASDLAEAWGLGGPGAAAVRACTDKHALRLLAAEAGLPQPRFATVTSPDDVRDFLDGRPVVLKPTNRRASVGVVRINSESEVEGAWRFAADAHEGARTAADRDLVWRFQVEEYLDGPEVSVESVVAAGDVVFDNVTAKRTVGGRYFTEVAHTVPAPLDSTTREELVAAVHTLLAAMRAVDGVFHSEWRLGKDGPRLIECAARPPGDLIPFLLARVCGVDLYEAFVTVLSRRPLTLSPVANGVAAVRFFQPPPGEFVRLDGAGALADAPDIPLYEVNLHAGQRVPAFENSWQRAGYYVVESTDHATLERRIETIERKLTFVVR